MAKNLKLNIKNTQLAQALNLNELRGKLAAKIGPKPDQKSEPKAEHKPTPKEQIKEAKALEAPIAARPPESTAKKLKLPKVEVPKEEELKDVSPKVEVPSTKSEWDEIASEAESEIVEEEAPKVKARDKQKPSLDVAPRDSYDRTRTTNRPGSLSRSSKPLPFATDWKLKGGQMAPSAEAPAAAKPKLGFTGRHVKDLIKPKAPPAPAPRPQHAGPGTGGGQERPRHELRPRPEPRQINLPPKEGAVQRRPQVTKPSLDDSSANKKGPLKRDSADSSKFKKQPVRGFDGRDRQGLRNDEEERWRKRRAAKGSAADQDQLTIRPTTLKVRLPISIKDLASEMKLKASQLVAKLFLQGVITTLNDFLDDPTTVELLGQEFGCTIQIDTSEEERIRITSETIQEEIARTDEAELVLRAPVVAFMGHVDHGKTSLIDAIRKSQVAAQEAGAITQHIGAFRCHTPVGDLTILDTPGHEAFSAMRTRGAEATDIVVLVVAGDEGMKQQTLEALEQARQAKVTIVVAINKCDKPDFDAERIYQQLATNELLPEAWGGSVVTVNCSAKTGQGIDQLLEMLALQAEVLELKANPAGRARGLVLESEMQKGMGMVTTLLVKNGTLHLGDAVVFDEYWGRVRTMRDETGKHLTAAGPSCPVEITGLSGLPEAGHEFIVVPTEKEAKDISEERQQALKVKSQQQKKKLSLENLAQQAESAQKKVAHCIIRADVQGSVEALKQSLSKIKSTKIDLNIVSAEVGEISESDVQLAAASGAFILGFHTQVESHAEQFIKDNGVKVLLHNIIYHAIDDVKKRLVEMLDKVPEESALGEARVQAIFKSSQLGVIAGCIVTEGSITRNARIRVVRGEKPLWTGTIASLRRVKEDVKEVKKGIECGIVLNGFQDFEPEDILQAFEIHYLVQEL